MRTIYWDASSFSVKMIDQRQLPASLVWVDCKSPEQIAEAIRSMVIRGAPVIGVAGAYGVVLAAIQYNESNRGDMDKAILASTVAIKQARPTAVNLGWAVDRMITLLDDQNIPCLELKDKLLAEAEKMADRVAILLSGEIVASGTPIELTATGAGFTKISVRTEGALLHQTEVTFPGVRQHIQKEEYIIFFTTEPGPTVSAIIEYLNTHNDPLIDLRVERPSLEDRFLEITTK